MSSNIEDVYVFPATYPQKQIWFINQLNQDSPAYNIPFAYDIKGDLNVEALKDAINEIVRRHETFRTTFADSDSGPVQVIFPELKIDVPLMDFSSNVAAEDEIKAFIDDESIRLFDLSKGPLIRASIIKRSDAFYTLFLNFHHIILDHISIVQFAEELSEIYAAYIEGKASPLVEPELQYADYSVWQIENQTHEKLQSKLEFWIEQLKGKPQYLDLPLDSPRPAMQSMIGEEYYLTLPLNLTQRLKNLSREESVSMFITLMSAYAMLFGIYSKQTGVSVGTPFANRSHQPELEKIMGCFINTIPIFTDLSGNPSFKDVLKRVRKMVFSASANQDLPFEMIVEELQPKRDTSFNPLFQVGFTFQEPPMEIELKNCVSKSQKLHNKSAKFDLLAWLWDSDEGVRGILEFNSEIFERSSVERFARHYQTLLQNAVDNPDAPISDLSILSDEEFEKIIKEWNHTEKTFNKAHTIHGLFEDQCVQCSDKVAAICDGEEFTYAELNERANKLAHYLISHNVKNGDLVGVCLERSLDMLVATLGILKTGACYIPLDPEYPQDRIQYMLENSASKVVVTQSAVQKRIQFPESVESVCIDQSAKDIAEQSSANPNVETQKDDLAYIIYTSGSTGKPKGVMVHHGAVSNFLSSMAETPGLNADDTLLAVTTLSFDIAVLELYLPLSQGATVVIATTEEAIDGEDLLDLMEEHKISIMQATPATWRLLLASNWDGDSSLKILCGGEAMPRDLLKDLLPRVKEVWNMYGPTETTVWSSCTLLTDAEAPILIGKPIANTQMYVLDEHLKPVPTGIYGELYIGGEGVTKGYLNRDDLTQERYINNPFGASGEKLYRTGDLVKFHETGDLEYYQRIDNQVKVRGFRIELGEIESVLTQQEGIEQAVVVVNEARAGDPRLVAYVVLAEGMSVTATSVRNLIRNDLPDYMLPQHVMEMDELPLTPNGKIDRKALPNPFAEQTAKAEIITPRSYAEIELAKIWAEVLNTEIDKISVYDNFFEIGGHSLLSMQVIVKIKEATGVKLNPREIILSTLEHIAEQCGFVETETAEEDLPVDDVKKNTRSFKSVLKNIFKK